MYDVYIKNTKKKNGSVNTNEQLMFSIPNTGKFPISKPIVKQDEDSADNFQFSMESDSPYYDVLLPLKTVIRVEYDGTIIFMGRVLSISTSSVFQTKSVTCEGVMAYFNDSFYEGKQEKHRKEITVEDYFEKLIDNHNSQVPAKKILKGNIGITLPTEKQKYEPSSWTQTFSALNSLTNANGGHFCIRYSGTTPYLDWYKYYVRDRGDGKRPFVTVGKNIIDISSEQNVNDIFTRVIPIGGSKNNGKTVYIDGYKYKDKNNANKTHSGKAFPISKVLELYSNSELTDEFHSYKDYQDAESLYGIIYKTVDFSDLTTQSKLWNTTKKWVKDCYFGLCSSFTIKAIDMHISNSSYKKILLGECVDINYKIVQNGEETWVTKKLVCKSAQYDLFNPENNSYTFGIPTDLLEKSKYNKKSSKNTVSENAAKKPYTPGTQDNSWTFYKIYQMIGTRDGKDHPEFEGSEPARSFWDNGETFGAVRDFYDPNEVVGHNADGSDITIGNNPKDYKQYWFKGRTIGKIGPIEIDGVRKPTAWVGVSEDRGIFAFRDYGDPGMIVHWYVQKKASETVTYTPNESAIPSFEKIARMIESDTDSTYGGQSNANSFRGHGKINASVLCYDPDKVNSAPSTANDPNVFNANIVGKFSVGGATTKYVAISDRYGIFAFYYGPSQFQPVRHWYQRGSGLSYENPTGLITTETPGSGGHTVRRITTTDNGTPEGNPTVEIDPATNDGQINVGNKDNSGWRIKLNSLITYRDANGHTRTDPGFVTAEDFNVSEIPSFKTKLGVFDTVVAGVVYANDIKSELAYIRSLKSELIDANIGVVAGRVKATSISATSISANNISLIVSSEGGSGSETSSLKGCFNSVTITPGTGEDAGKIVFDFYKVGGGTPYSANFNIADTQFYQDAVSAALTTGWKAARSIISSSMPSSDAATGFPTSYNIRVPNSSGYNVGYTNYPVSISNLTDYQPAGVSQSVKVFNVNWNGHVICRREVKLQTIGPVDPPTTEAETYEPGSNYHGIGKIIINPANLDAAKDTGWNNARAIIINSLPTSSTQAVNTNTTWNLHIPKSGYGNSNHYDERALTVSDPENYQPPGVSQTIPIINVKIGKHIAYRKEVKLTPQSVTPKATSQSITPSSSYWGFNKVTVPALSIGTPSISSSRTYSGTLLNIKSALVAARQNDGYVIITFSVSGASGVTKTFYIKASDILN